MTSMGSIRNSDKPMGGSEGGGVGKGDPDTLPKNFKFSKTYIVK